MYKLNILFYNQANLFQYTGISFFLTVVSRASKPDGNTCPITIWVARTKVQNCEKIEEIVCNLNSPD